MVKILIIVHDESRRAELPVPLSNVGNVVALNHGCSESRSLDPSVVNEFPFDLVVHHCGVENPEYHLFFREYAKLCVEKQSELPPMLFFSGDGGQVKIAQQRVGQSGRNCFLTQSELNSRLRSANWVTRLSAFLGSEARDVGLWEALWTNQAAPEVVVALDILCQGYLAVEGVRRADSENRVYESLLATGEAGKMLLERAAKQSEVVRKVATWFRIGIDAIDQSISASFSGHAMDFWNQLAAGRPDAQEDVARIARLYDQLKKCGDEPKDDETWYRLITDAHNGVCGLFARGCL